MERSLFGLMEDGRPVEQFTLDNGCLRCSIITYGAALTGLWTPGRDGMPVDVALGFDRLADYRQQDKFMGAVVGRYANRIARGRFSLDGQAYTLAQNDGENSLHGGPTGFATRLWQAEEVPGGVMLTYDSADGEEGFPGRLTASVTYLLDRHSLRLHYRAVSDRPTPCSLTNHTYFNLNGHNGGSAMEQVLTLFSTYYTPVFPGGIPTGELAAVEGSPMDFRTPTRIGSRIDQRFRQLTLCSGYDHNWVIDGAPGTLRPAARLMGERTGVVMAVDTTLPGIQFYAGNDLDGCPAGKGGALYGRRDAVCLETQFFPDSPNHAEFPSCILRPGQVWEQRTVFRFSAAH